MTKPYHFVFHPEAEKAPMPMAPQIAAWGRDVALPLMTAYQGMQESRICPEHLLLLSSDAAKVREAFDLLEAFFEQAKAAGLVEAL